MDQQERLTNLIQQRLDIGWANTDWILNFPEATISHLPRINLDHYPVLLNLEGPTMGSRERPFRFQPFWLSHLEFPVVVRQAWEGNEHQLPIAIVEFAVLARIWNKKVFGKFFWKKKILWLGC